MSEKAFEWNSALTLGVDHIDSEHKELIARMRRLAELNHKTFDKDLLLLAFDDLIRLTRQHFHDEEEYMRSIRYAQLEAHQRIHESFLEALNRYRLEMATSVYQRFPAAVFDFFKTWITTHILIVDRQYMEGQGKTVDPTV